VEGDWLPTTDEDTVDDVALCVALALIQGVADTVDVAAAPSVPALPWIGHDNGDLDPGFV